MRIWLSDIGEPLPHLSLSARLQRYGRLSTALAERGHDVTWWTCNFEHQSKRFASPPNAEVFFRGVRIRLVGGPGYHTNISPRRVLHSAVHAWNLRNLISQEHPPNLVLSAVPTVEASYVLARYCAKKCVPLVVDIRDEAPEDWVRLAPTFLKGFFRAVLAPYFFGLRFSCSTAAAISAVSEQQLAYGLKHANRRREPSDMVFASGASDPLLAKSPETGEVEELIGGLKRAGFFVCAFSGTMTSLRPLGPILEAIRKLQDRFKIALVIAGSGNLEEQYRHQSIGLPVHFLGWRSEADIAYLHRNADLLLAPYNARFGFSLPTKFFDYLGAGKPIFSNCAGDVRRIITERGVGVFCDSDDPIVISEAIAELRNAPEVRLRMGSSARQVFEEAYEINDLIARFSSFLEERGRPRQFT